MSFATIGEPLVSGYTVYGSPNCTFCEKAKSLLQDYDIQFKYYDVDNYYGRAQRKVFFEQIKASGRVSETTATIPVIFKDNKFIGGFIQLKNQLVKTLTIDEDF